MAEFKVKVTQTEIGYITVKADSRREAKILAASDWYEGKTEWATGQTSLSLTPEEDANV